jgi:hypothetical protein
VLHQVEGGEKHPPFGGSDVGGEPRPRGDASEVGQARLQGGAITQACQLECAWALCLILPQSAPNS